MSCVASSLVSSSAFRVFARSAERLTFFSFKSRRYFSISFFGILTGFAVLVGIVSFSFSRSCRNAVRLGTRDHNREFRREGGLLRTTRAPRPRVPGPFDSGLAGTASALPKGLARDPETLRGKCPIPAGAPQRLGDVQVGELLEGPSLLDGRGHQTLRRSERPR